MVEQLQYSISDFFKIPNNYFKLAGILFSKKKSLPKTKRERYKELIIFFYFLFWFFCNILIIISLTVQITIDADQDSTTPILMVITLILKTTMIYMRKENISKLIAEFHGVFKEQKIRNNQCQDLMRFRRIFHRFTKLTLYSRYLAIFAFIIYKGFDFITEYLWIPFQLHSFYLMPFCVLEMYIATINTYVNFANDLTVITLIKLVALSFENLSTDIEKLNTLENVEKMHRLKEIVDKHVRLFALIKKVEKIISPLLALHFLQISTIMISNGIRILHPKHNQEVFYFVPFLFEKIVQTLIICYFGQLIIDASLQVANVAFDNIEWHQSDDTQYRKAIQFLILRSQKEQSIKAGSKKTSLRTFTLVRKKRL